VLELLRFKEIEGYLYSTAGQLQKTTAGMACFLAALSCSQGYMQRAALEVKPLLPCSNVSTCLFLPRTIKNICCNSICSSDPHPPLRSGPGGSSSSFTRGNRCRKKGGVPPTRLERRQLVLKGVRFAPGSQRLSSAPEQRCGAEMGIPSAEGLGLWAPSF